MLPGIDIQFENGNVSNVVVSPDGVLGLIGNAVAVSPTFVLDTPYILKGMTDVAALGITDSIDNHILYKALSEFYAEAGEGTELWLIGKAQTTKMSDWFTPVSGKTPAETLLDAANGRIRGLLTAFNPDGSYTSTITDGFDADVLLARTKAQTLAENYTTNKYAPIFVIIDGYNYDGTLASIVDLSLESNNRTAVLVGDTETRTGTTASKGSAVGVLGGRIARIKVSENIGKVKLGPLKPLKIYILDTPIESFDVASLHDKSYITFRQHVGRSGYFFTYDPLATLPTDDYNHLSNRRVIDKAYRLAYGVLLNELLDDFSLNNDGTISPFFASELSAQVRATIESSMTNNEELSHDPTDKDDQGVICSIDTSWNVQSTSKIKLNYLRVRLRGQAEFIDVPLGFVPAS